MTQALLHVTDVDDEGHRTFIFLEEVNGIVEGKLVEPLPVTTTKSTYVDPHGQVQQLTVGKPYYNGDGTPNGDLVTEFEKVTFLATGQTRITLAGNLSEVLVNGESVWTA